MANTASEKVALTRTTRQELTEIKRDLVWQGKVLGGGIGGMWALELLDTFVLRQALNAWGLVPGKVSGLLGVLTMPFLHGGLIHLMANTVPLALFAWLIMLRDNWEWGAVTAITMLSAGLGTWLFGATGSMHIGASGLVFGYFGYLLLMGVFQRKILSILLSLGVGLTYGGLVFGMLPFTVPWFVSWQAHLFGFLGGGAAAWWVNRQTRGGSVRLLEGKTI